MKTLESINNQLVRLFRQRHEIYTKIRIVNSEIQLLQNENVKIPIVEISDEEWTKMKKNYENNIKIHKWFILPFTQNIFIFLQAIFIIERTIYHWGNWFRNRIGRSTNNNRAAFQIKWISYKIIHTYFPRTNGA